MQKKMSFVGLLIFLFLSVATSAQQISGKVTHVKDGDSFVMIADGKTFEVRLDGIDCPEKGQPFSAKAKQFTFDQVNGRIITVKINGYDKYKRALGKVYLPGNKILNEQLLIAGYAWHYKKYNSDQRLAKMETKARSAGVGLWHDPEPISPWDYRQLKRQKNILNTK